MTGKVVRVVSDKGFGFIKADGSEDEYFFHRTAIKNGNFSSVRVGAAVTFEGEEGNKGLRAEDVYL